MHVPGHPTLAGPGSAWRVAHLRHAGHALSVARAGSAIGVPHRRASRVGWLVLGTRIRLRNDFPISKFLTAFSYIKPVLSYPVLGNFLYGKSLLFRGTPWELPGTFGPTGVISPALRLTHFHLPRAWPLALTRTQKTQSARHACHI